MTNNAIVWTIAVLIAAALIIMIATTALRRRDHLRTVKLRRQFGPEYNRAVEELGSPARAERELAARARRVERVRFRELSDFDRRRFTSAWSNIQAQFVDDPALAVQTANALIQELMLARGYPSGDYEHRVADLSVEHPAVVQHYRAAWALSESSRNGQANTEELRQAVVHYRVLFADLLQESGSGHPSLHEMHA